ncbi:sensor histidine kinase [Hymenobacter psoromatis]|uniref:sensor histidine kinase n=1 Tax=Hymenobacter psoromatis TaxID=1484116 RepID=UPI001CBC1168|nr:HAMP domain-containing sensor histidine kinase [Hymenobacter psoromatis]
MKRRIWLATGLLLLAALGVLAFQGYWTYQTYRQASWRLRQDSQAALVVATQQAVATQNERLLIQYARWLQDTTHVRLSCRVNQRDGRTQFKLAGVPARKGDQTELSFEDFKPRVAHLTPAARAYFIKRFVGGTVRDELTRGYIFFHTQWLGQQLSAAMAHSHTTPAEFRQVLAVELRRRGLLALPFRLYLRDVADPDSLRSAPAAYSLALEPVGFGVRNHLGQVAQVWLPAAPGVVRGQLQGVLLASGALLALVLSCTAYAVGTMQRQKKLAALKADFTQNMTHELKTPVASIQLAADSLRHFALDAATSAEYAALIGEQATRLGGLIDRILQSVALERAALPLRRQPVAWAELVAELAARQQLQFAQAGRQLCWQQLLPATVLGDAAHLTNTLATLLDNALKYGGQRVDLRSELLPTAVALHLTDDGPGIAAEYQARVFEQFFRVPTGDLHAVKGYGLGLHYARQVAQAHGGTLTLCSQPGRGTTFTLSLPLAP